MVDRSVLALYPKDGPVTAEAELPVYSMEQIADYLTDGFWEAANRTRRAFDTDDRPLTFDVSGLTLDAQYLARAALSAWSDVSGIEFVDAPPIDLQLVHEGEDVGTSLETAKRVGVDQRIEGKIDTRFDVDWYVVEMKAGQSYYLKLSGSDETGGLGPTWLTVRNRDGDILGRDTDGLGDYSAMEWVAPEDGTYIVDVATIYGDKGSYHLDIIRGKAVDLVIDDYAQGAFATTRKAGDKGGDVELSFVNVPRSFLSEYGSTLDSGSFHAFIHEIGHALGLGHAGYYNGWVRYGRDNHYENDSWQASIMSYFNQRENTAVDAGFAYVMTPMAADILAIQELYGTKVSTRPGDTVYGSNSNVSGYLGALFAGIFDGDSERTAYQGRPVTMTLFDTGGIDTLDASTGAVDQSIDLQPEGISSLMGQKGNLVIAGQTIIENATGGFGNDLIRGNRSDNLLIGGGGEDHIWGGAGQDILRGGNGHDTLLGNNRRDFLFGGRGEDTLVGGNGYDRLFGGGGDDRLDGGARNDRLTGGGGADTFVFAKGRGVDRIRDFEDDIDALELNSDLWTGNFNLETVFSSWASVEIAGVVFRFDSGDVLTLSGLSDISVLLDDTTII